MVIILLMRELQQISLDPRETFICDRSSSRDFIGTRRFINSVQLNSLPNVNWRRGLIEIFFLVVNSAHRLRALSNFHPFVCSLKRYFQSVAICFWQVSTKKERISVSVR